MIAGEKNKSHFARMPQVFSQLDELKMLEKTSKTMPLNHECPMRGIISSHFHVLPAMKPLNQHSQSGSLIPKIATAHLFFAQPFLKHIKPQRQI